MRQPEEIKKGLEYRSCIMPGEFYGETLAYIRQLEAKVEQLEAQVPRWISVKERLPEDESNYLVWNGSYINVAICWGDSWWPAGGYIVNDITHWMPFPEPPKEEE